MSASILFCPAPICSNTGDAQAQAQIMRQRQTCFMLWCGKGGNDNVVFNLKEISDLGLANVMRMIGEGV